MQLTTVKPDRRRKNSRVEKVAIIGLGLIGGSLGLALLQGGLVGEVIGYDCDPETTRAALECGAISQVVFDLQAAAREAELIILAVPVGNLVQVAKDIAPALQRGTIVTDTGSVKESIVRELEAILQPPAFYVGGHPMAGSEKAGIRAADRYLLENAVYVLTPTPATDPQALQQLDDLFRAVGSRVITLEPGEHDLVVAGVSHLPHLLAITLMQTAGELAAEHPLALMLAAGGFRDTTRIAASDPIMWRDIFLHNRTALQKMLADWRQQIDIMQAMIDQNDAAALEKYIRQARELRSQVPKRQKGLLPALHELVVTVPDRPGIIGRLATLLGNEDINIINIEILRVREGEGGSIRLGFTTANAAGLAREILQRAGYKVTKYE